MAPTRKNQRPVGRYRKLKPRPGGSGTEVAEHQRARIHAATIDLVDEEGYRSLTVTAIARAAGVSNRTFYDNFKDKDECFIATYDMLVRRTVRGILEARSSTDHWPTQIRAGFLAFAEKIADNPKAARFALVEAFACRGALERMRHTDGLFAALVTESFSREGGALPPLIAKAIVGGGMRIARSRLLAGEETLLPADGEELMRWSLSLRSDAANELCARAMHGGVPLPSKPPVTNGTPVMADNGTIDERRMILSAVARLAAREGYDALTVPRIRAAAGVSRRRFDEHFTGVSDAFLATLDLLVGRVLAKARADARTVDCWPAAVYRGIATICDEIAADPVLVKLLFVEVFVPGPETIRWRGNLMAGQSAFLRMHAPPAQRPSALAAEASIGAAWALLLHYAETGRAHELPRLAGILTYVLLAPAIGGEAATRLIRVEEEDAEPARSADNLRRGV